MALRLPRWLHRHRAPAGRHALALPATGTAQTLVEPAPTPAPVAPTPAETAHSPATTVIPASAPVPPTEDRIGSAVGLGFADGASVELDSDDPRVRTFRAAAAALLDTPRG